MREFPRPMLVMAFLCLVPALLSVFFLFALHPFGQSDNVLLNFLQYLATQLLWLLPIAAFFAGLNRERRGYRRIAYAILSAGLVLAVIDVLLVAL